MSAGDGYTDALVLEAPVVWWPSFRDLTEYPLEETRTFFSAVTEHAVPHPTTQATSRPSVQLSRLGRSIFTRARWEVTSATGRTVCVWNPFSGTHLHLGVVSTSAQGTAAARSATDAPAGGASSLPGPAFLELVAQGRVRVRPQLVTSAAQAPASGSPSHTTLTRAEELLAVLTARYAHEVVKSCQDFLDRFAAGYVGTPVHAVLVEGGAGTGKAAVLDHVMRCVPEIYAGGAHVGSACTFLTERRVLNFADVLAMDTREAIHIVKTVLKPPPLAPLPVHTEVSAAPVRPAVVVALRHVELLWESANAVTTAVVYQLGSSLDALSVGLPDYDDDDAGEMEGAAHSRPPTVPLVLLSTASDTSRVPISLLRHLIKDRVALGASTLTERIAFLSRLTAPSSASSEPALSLPAVEAVGETLSGCSLATLLRMTAEEVRQRAAILTADREAHRKQMPLLSPQPLAGCCTGPYSHLFGVEAVVASLEMLLVWPLTHLGDLRRLRIPCAKGAILYGPSGSGKTAIMRALADRLRNGADTRWLASVQLIDGLTLVEKEVGRSEKNIAAMFRAARAAAPTVLLLDNLEALAPPRGRQSSETTTSSDRTLSTLLTEMDGVAGDGGQTVLVVACAPSPEFLDPAVRRPGRLDVHLHLTSPSASTVLDAMTAQLVRVVERLAQPASDAATSTELREAVQGRLRAAQRQAGAESSTLSAAQVGALTREITLRLVRAVVGEAEAFPGEGVAADTLLDVLDTVLKEVM